MLIGWKSGKRIQTVSKIPKDTKAYDKKFQASGNFTFEYVSAIFLT